MCGGGGGGLMMRLCRYTFAGMHLIRVAEHLGVRLRRPHPEPSTTKNSSSSRAEKWALTSSWTEFEKCGKMRQKRPSSVLEYPVDEQVCQTAGNLFLHVRATSTTIEGTAPAAPPRISAGLNLAHLSLSTTGMARTTCTTGASTT